MNNWETLCKWTNDSFDWDEQRLYQWLLAIEARALCSDMDVGDMMEALESGLQYTMNDAKVWVIEHDNIYELFDYIKDDVASGERGD